MRQNNFGVSPTSRRNCSMNCLWLTPRSCETAAMLCRCGSRTNSLMAQLTPLFPRAFALAAESRCRSICSKTSNLACGLGAARSRSRHSQMPDPQSASSSTTCRQSSPAGRPRNRAAPPGLKCAPIMVESGSASIIRNSACAPDNQPRLKEWNCPAHARSNSFRGRSSRLMIKSKVPSGKTCSRS